MRSTLEDLPARTVARTRPARRPHTRVAHAGAFQHRDAPTTPAPPVGIGAAELAEAIRVLASLGWLTVVAGPDGQLSLRLVEDAS